MATKKEKTNIRDLFFSGWIRENCPDSKNGFMVSDIDFVLFNFYEKKIIIVEEKQKCGQGDEDYLKSKIPEWQRNMYVRFQNWITKGIYKDWTFLGCHLIQFENTCFADGKCYLNYEETSEAEIKKLLSLK